MTSKTPAHNTDIRLPSGMRVPRLRPKLRRALEEMAVYGHNQRAAAEIAGMDESALGRAIKKPHVAAQLEQMKSDAYTEAAALKHLARGAAVRVGMDLLHNSKDDRIRARMVEFFAGESKQPLVAVQINSAAAGYHYPRPQDFASGADRSQVIDNKDE